MSEGLVPLPVEFWRSVLRAQAATYGEARQGDLHSSTGRCRGCGSGMQGLYAVAGLAPAKDGYLCGGCWARTYGGER